MQGKEGGRKRARHTSQGACLLAYFDLWMLNGYGIGILIKDDDDDDDGEEI